MNILCYGVSRQRQLERCEFFEGIGFYAEAVTVFSELLERLSTTHFDAVVLGNHIGASECEALSGLMLAIQPALSIFSLAQLESQLYTCDPKDRDLSNVPDRMESLVAVYTQLQLRSERRDYR